MFHLWGLIAVLILFHGASGSDRPPLTILEEATDDITSSSEDIPSRPLVEAERTKPPSCDNDPRTIVELQFNAVPFYEVCGMIEFIATECYQVEVNRRMLVGEICRRECPMVSGCPRARTYQTAPEQRDGRRLEKCNPWQYLSGGNCWNCPRGSVGYFSGYTTCHYCPWGTVRGDATGYPLDKCRSASDHCRIYQASQHGYCQDCPAGATRLLLC